jgi:hypothetical protein
VYAQWEEALLPPLPLLVLALPCVVPSATVLLLMRALLLTELHRPCRAHAGLACAQLIANHWWQGYPCCCLGAQLRPLQQWQQQQWQRLLQLLRVASEGTCAEL